MQQRSDSCSAINAFKKMLSDTHASYYEHIVMDNAVGCPGGDAHPAGAGLQAIGYQSARAHTQRNIKGIAIVKSHFGYEKRVDLEIDEKLQTLAALVSSFSEMWHQLYDRGEIKPSPVPKTTLPRGNTVDLPS